MSRNNADLDREYRAFLRRHTGDAWEPEGIAPLLTDDELRARMRALYPHGNKSPDADNPAVDYTPRKP